MSSMRSRKGGHTRRLARRSRRYTCASIAAFRVYVETLPDQGKALCGIEATLSELGELSTRTEGFLEEWEAERTYSIFLQDYKEGEVVLGLGGLCSLAHYPG
ncbi:hypothetical protein [Infirmifilum uzonense]|uniref:hypothetical protein n=1 Tax=Infirmifilum uzonense TaxID=1550241 RepID=UPI003C75C474